MNTKELKEDIKYWLDRTERKIRRPFRWLKRHIFNKAHIKLIGAALTMEPWDWVYQLELERAGLERMIAYHKKVQTVSDWERIVKEMEICVGLIKIATGETDIAVPNNKYFTDYKLNRHVNIRNACRWVDKFYVDSLNRTPLSLDSGYMVLRLEDYYQEKARKLYHKLRSFYETRWWD